MTDKDRKQDMKTPAMFSITAKEKCPRCNGAIYSSWDAEAGSYRACIACARPYPPTTATASGQAMKTSHSRPP